MGILPFTSATSLPLCPHIYSPVLAADDSAFKTHTRLPRGSPTLSGCCPKSNNVVTGSLLTSRQAGTRIKNTTRVPPRAHAQPVALQHTRREAHARLIPVRHAGLYATCTQVHSLVVGCQKHQNMTAFHKPLVEIKLPMRPYIPPYK